jgi:hypothetical protein
MVDVLRRHPDDLEVRRQLLLRAFGDGKLHVFATSRKDHEANQKQALKFHRVGISALGGMNICTKVPRAAPGPGAWYAAQ